MLLASFTMSRYGLGGDGYQDPVPFDLVFQIDNTTGLPAATFEPMIEVGSIHSPFVCERYILRSSATSYVNISSQHVWSYFCLRLELRVNCEPWHLGLELRV